VAASDASVTSARNSRIAGWLVAGALVIVAVVIGAILAFGEHSRGRTSLARAGDFSFAVNRVETTDVIADPEYPELNVTAAGRFVVVKLTVTNVSASEQTFSANFSTVSDGITEYRVDDAAWRLVGEASRAVDPGRSIETAVVFDVPKGVALQTIVLRDERLSGGVAIGL
jgi:hypothetical protein